MHLTLHGTAHYAITGATLTFSSLRNTSSRMPFSSSVLALSMAEFAALGPCTPHTARISPHTHPCQLIHPTPGCTCVLRAAVWRPVRQLLNAGAGAACVGAVCACVYACACVCVCASKLTMRRMTSSAGCAPSPPSLNTRGRGLSNILAKTERRSADTVQQSTLAVSLVDTMPCYCESRWGQQPEARQLRRPRAVAATVELCLDSRLVSLLRAWYSSWNSLTPADGARQTRAGCRLWN